MLYIYFVGPAGSGKSTLVYAFQQWMNRNGLDTITVNLDPGAETVPYAPDVDIRDWISLDEVMKEHQLGPNGAQVVCSDLMALNSEEWIPVVKEFKTNYVLIDTPGQMELFAFRQSSKVITESLGPDQSFIVFLSDPQLAKTPNGFVSSMVLCALTHFRFSIPILNILSKSDLLTESELDTVMEWSDDPYGLQESLTGGQMPPQAMLNVEFFKAMENLGMFTDIAPVSSESFEGMEDIYNTIQQAYMGGEDLSPD